MILEVWIAYIGTVLVLMITPGPSQLLILSNSLGNGFTRSLATAAGDLTANFLQMVVASLGLASLLFQAKTLFIFFKWAGVAYLIYLGVKTITGGGEHHAQKSAQVSITKLYLQGFFTSAANPKAVLFFAALFPQFIDPARPLLYQFAALSMTYLTMDAIFLCCYGRFADTIRNGRLPFLTSDRMNYCSGSLLIGAAILLGLKDLEQ